MSVISTLTLDRLDAAHSSWHTRYHATTASDAEKVAHHEITAAIAGRGGAVECSEVEALILDRAQGLSTDPESYGEDLPVEVVAALRQAWEAGVPLADVASVLGPRGYEIRVLPCEPTDDPEEQFASLAGIETEYDEEPEYDDETEYEVLDRLRGRVMDALALRKGYSFEIENRLIARNKKRKGAKDPHPFKPSRYVTRDGRVRCVMCGGGEPEKGACSGLGYTKAAADVKVGDFVSWNSSGGTARGRVEHVMTEGVFGVPDSDFSVRAEPGNPAVAIRVWERGPEGWRETEVVVGHKASTLRRISDLRKAAPMKTEDGEQYPAEAFAYVPDPERPSTWKLRLWDSPDEKVTAAQVGRAVAALGPGGFRGNRVEIPAEDLPGVKRRILAAWRSVHDEGDQPPAVLKAETYSPPQGVREAARRALDWIKDGKAGANFTDVGRARAAQLARGDAVSRETIGRMRSYFARHEVDRQAEGFSSGEDGFPSPGRVAWDAWGGDAGRSWVNGLWQRIEKAEAEGTYDPEDALSPRQQVMYDAYEMIAEAFGPWDGGVGAEGAHYIPAAENVFAEKGMKCANCVYFEGGGGCEILSMPVEPEGACKLWIIPEHLVGESPEAEPEEMSLGKSAAFVQKADERRYTMGPMYVPNMVDAHGEWTDPDELQSAVWEYVRAGDRGIRLQHNRSVVAGEWVEVLAWPYEVTVPMFGAEMDGRKLTYPANTVFLGVVWEPWAWEMVKAGKLRGYSIGGKADRVLADLPGAEGEPAA